MKLFSHINKKIILASQSPRRKHLLEEILKDTGIILETVSYNFTETIPQIISPEEISKQIAKDKATSLLEQYPHLQQHIIITADTLVFANSRILGKPLSNKQAIEFLQILSNNTHKVVSAVYITTKDFNRIIVDTALVKFSKLSEDTIQWYVDKYSPLDKAGAYGIQEWIGYVGIEKIDGSFYTVMGLPTHKIYQVLEEYDSLQITKI